MRTFSTRLRAPSSSSWARAGPAPTTAPPASASIATRPAKAGRGTGRLRGGDGLTRGRPVVALDGGPVLDGAGEVVEQDEDDEPADEHQPDPLVGEGEPLG